MNETFALDEIEIVTLFVLTEQSIKNQNDFMASGDFKALPATYRDTFEERLTRTKAIHSRFCGYLSQYISEKKLNDR